MLPFNQKLLTRCLANVLALQDMPNNNTWGRRALLASLKEDLNNLLGRNEVAHNNNKQC